MFLTFVFLKSRTVDMASAAGSLVLLLLAVSTLCITVGLAEELSNAGVGETPSLVGDTEDIEDQTVLPELSPALMEEEEKAPGDRKRTGNSPPSDTSPAPVVTPKSTPKTTRAPRSAAPSAKPATPAKSAGSGRTNASDVAKSVIRREGVPPGKNSESSTTTTTTKSSTVTQTTTVPSTTTSKSSTVPASPLKNTASPPLLAANPVVIVITTTGTSGNVVHSVTPNSTADGVSRSVADKAAGSQKADPLVGVARGAADKTAEKTTPSSSAPGSWMWEAVCMRMIWISILGLVAF